MAVSIPRLLPFPSKGDPLQTSPPSSCRPLLSTRNPGVDASPPTSSRPSPSTSDPRGFSTYFQQSIAFYKRPTSKGFSTSIQRTLVFYNRLDNVPLPSTRPLEELPSLPTDSRLATRTCSRAVFPGDLPYLEHQQPEQPPRTTWAPRTLRRTLTRHQPIKM